ncbi:MAG: cytochrome c [Kiloniellales bacterium]
MRLAVFICALVLVLFGAPSGSRAQGSPEKGREIATTHCARCHVVGDFNPLGGIGSTPSFQLLAKRDDYLERFGTFFERRPHPVFVRVPGVPKWSNLPSHVAEFEVLPESIEDIIAFVRTLRPAE